MGEVIQFTAKPKSDVYRHRRYSYTITYIPKSKLWEWEFVLSGMRIHGVKESHIEAVQAAKLHIDLSEGV